MKRVKTVVKYCGRRGAEAIIYFQDDEGRVTTERIRVDYRESLEKLRSLEDVRKVKEEALNILNQRLEEYLSRWCESDAIRG